MNQSNSLGLWCRSVLGASVVVLALAGCGSDGNDGAPGPEGPPGPPGPAAPGSVTSLSITVDSVTIASPPVVEFTATDQNGTGYAGLSDSDLRFNIAKLIPAAASPHGTSQWQNYIETGGSAMHGSQERLHTPPRASDVWGNLVNNGDGTYTYTFATDITAAPCPSPCTEADGTPLDLSYQPSYTHRVSIQQGNRDLPGANAVYDFVPSGAAVSSERIIVKTDNCNECHEKLTAHGSRFETKLCVTCHNPGSWVDATTPVDFKVMIHKIHRFEESSNPLNLLPHNDYAVGSHDFSDVRFPQDSRNCTKCHDGSDPASPRYTPQGNAWQTPNMAACGSCHDDIDFSKDGSVDPAGHPGGIVTDNTECTTCHAENRIAGSVPDVHTIPGKAERALFQFNILTICGTAVDANPVCGPGTNPTVTLSVTDPSGATTHGYGNAYNIRSDGDPEFNASAGGATRLALLIAWDTRDYTNEGGAGTRPSQADSIDLRTSTAVTDNGDGTFTVDGSAAGSVIPASAAGSGAIGIEGHPAADDGTGAFTQRVAVNSEVAYFAITDSTPQPRRVVVDAKTRCDNCHDVLSLHGGNRNNNTQLCVLCHNPSDTDVSQRPKDATTGLPDASVTLDGKQEESIDFKRLIHGIHGADERETGLVVYGFGGSEHDFSDVRFPGVLKHCETCHVDDTYTLADRSANGGGNWELPAMNGILGSTVNSFPNALADGTDFDAQLILQSDDWKYSPIASVCSSCHNGTLPMAHMANNGAIFGLAGSDQAAQEGNVESCPVCHGPGALADVAVVHE